MSFDAAQCVASRDYGSQDEPVTLVFKAPAKGGVIQLALIRKGQMGEFAEQRKASLRYGDGPEREVSVLMFSPARNGQRVILYNLSREEVAGWATAGVLQLRASHLDESLQVSGLAPLMKVMDECVEDLRRYWNFAEEQAPPKLRERAKGSLVGLFRSGDYPAVALNSDQTGIVGVVVLVNEKGRVADCTLVQTSGVASLDGQTCAIIKERGRFKPAIGLDGKPARDVQDARINWKMR